MSKKKIIPNPPLEYRMKAKKLKIIGESSITGDTIVTQFEQEPVLVDQKFIKSRNPKKEILWQLRNKYDEQIQLAHYQGNDYINVFVNGGVHSSRFVLSLKGMGELRKVLKYYIDKLTKKLDQKDNKSTKNKGFVGVRHDEEC